MATRTQATLTTQFPPTWRSYTSRIPGMSFQYEWRRGRGGGNGLRVRPSGKVVVIKILSNNTHTNTSTHTHPYIQARQRKVTGIRSLRRTYISSLTLSKWNRLCATSPCQTWHNTLRKAAVWFRFPVWQVLWKDNSKTHRTWPRH